MACNIHVELTTEPLCSSHVLNIISDDLCGAQMIFLGCTRRITGDRETERLSYDAYHEMARRELHSLAEIAASKWPVRHIAIQHRLGEVAVGEASVLVGVSSPHRAAVMESIPWMMDRLKEDVPIWKKEQFADGTSEWIHR